MVLDSVGQQVFHYFMHINHTYFSLFGNVVHRHDCNGSGKTQKTIFCKMNVNVTQLSIVNVNIYETAFFLEFYGSVLFIDNKTFAIRDGCCQFGK